MTTNPASRRMRIGVVAPIAEDPETGHIDGYQAIRAFALRAEAAGVDSLWVFDHLLYRLPDRPTFGIWEAWSILAGLAEATARVQLGTIVMCTAFRNPALLAKMAVTVDEISGGRVILGLGAGWHRPEFEAFGYPFDHLASRFEEALQIIVPLLREGRVDFQGAYSSAPNCELRPRGPRPGGIPILIAAKQPRMLRLTAHYADAWNTAWLGQPTLLAERRAALEAACAAEGRDPSSLEITVGVNLTCPADVQADARLDPARTLAGSPEEVASVLRRYAELGVGHAICALSSTTPESLDWFAQVLVRYQA